MAADLFPPYDRTLSLHLDALIIALETRPAWHRRAWLKLAKRLAERRVPLRQVTR